VKLLAAASEMPSKSVASRVICTAPSTSAAQQGETPVVLILGWWGAKDRAVSRFAQLYADRGYAVCQFIALGNESFGSPPVKKKVAQSVLNEVSRRCQSNDFSSAAPEVDAGSAVWRKDKPPPIVVHIMSNNGAMMYLAMLQCAREEHGWLLQGLRGVVYDCSPGHLSAFTGMRAFLATRPPLALKLAFVGFPLMVGLGLLALVFWLGRGRPLTTGAGVTAVALLAAFSERYRTEKYIQELASDPSDCPQLFLYSKGDVLIPDTVIEDLAARRSAKGVQVLKKKWITSGHMELLRDNGAEYAETLFAFLSSLGNRARAQTTGGQLSPHPPPAQNLSGFLASVGSPVGKTKSMPAKIHSSLEEP